MKNMRVEIWDLFAEGEKQAALAAARSELGQKIETLEKARFYLLATEETPDKFWGANELELLSNPLLQKAYYQEYDPGFSPDPQWVVQVMYRPGVTDNEARALEEALVLLGHQVKASSGKLYFFWGDVAKKDLEKFATEHLANGLIQKVEVLTLEEFQNSQRFERAALSSVQLGSEGAVETIDLEIADEKLLDLSKNRCLALTLEEMQAIREHYRDPKTCEIRRERGLPEAPTDVELEVFAQTWSEHCKHKIFSSTIDYTEDESAPGPKLGDKQIKSVFKTFIRSTTEKIIENRKLDWAISVFHDNAGIVRFDKNRDVCIKVETHNSPSALDPYGGALTGILGVNRDILGVGLGARPIANMDVFCFCPPQWPGKGQEDSLPKGPRSPEEILKGVHKGVEDGGNKSGIPTVNGAFFFDKDYAGKPLVFVGTVGELPPVLPDGRQSWKKEPRVGDRIVVAGGAVGADGIHGATFSSLELDENAPATAVQIGDPLTQRRLTDFLLEARDKGLYSAVTDNGAGGLSSSVGEMATFTGGARLELSRHAMKYPGLAPYEIMISESQERMTFAVPEEKIAAFLELAKRRGVLAADLGHFCDDGLLEVTYKDELVGLLELDFLHDGLPPMELKARWRPPMARKTWGPKETKPTCSSVREALLALLSSSNIKSKEPWVRRYDHEVQGATQIGPFAGHGNGPNDSGVIRMKPHGGEEETTLHIGCGLAPRISLADTYHMAQWAVDEAMRNVVATGGDPSMVCLLDNFCWPDPVESPKNPEGQYKLAQLVRANQGLAEICELYGAPLVSGKDSMKNDFKGVDRKGQALEVSVLPTLLVTAMAKGEASHLARSPFQSEGDAVYRLGAQGSGLYLSELAELFTLEESQSGLPTFGPREAFQLYQTLHEAFKKGLISSCHDLSDGGLAVAISECAIGSGLGAKIDISASFDVLFNEAPGRFVVSVAAEKQSEFEKLFHGLPFEKIGHVTNGPTLEMGGQEFDVAELARAWRGEL